MKALHHLRYLLSKNHIQVKQEDKDALNEVIRKFNEIEQTNLRRHKLFTKLFINEFLRHSEGHNAKYALDEVERLLSLPVSEYYAKMRTEVPYLRFKRLSEQKGLTPLYEFKNGKIKVNPNADEKNKPIFEKYHKELKHALRDYSYKETKTFLDNTLHNLILKYIKYD